MSSDRARGSGWVLALHPDDRDRVAREWHECARLKQMFRAEYRFQRPDGKINWVFGQARAETEHGVVKSYVGTITDISNRRLNDERLQNYQALLRQLAAKLATTQEQERKKIASDLHDHIGQSLAVAKAKLGMLPRESSFPWDPLSPWVERKSSIRRFHFASRQISVAARVKHPAAKIAATEPDRLSV